MQLRATQWEWEGAEINGAREETMDKRVSWGYGAFWLVSFYMVLGKLCIVGGIVS